MQYKYVSNKLFGNKKNKKKVASRPGLSMLPVTLFLSLTFALLFYLLLCLGPLLS